MTEFRIDDVFTTEETGRKEIEKVVNGSTVPKVSRPENGTRDKWDTNVPNTIYDNLPLLLSKACAVFPNERERDVFLTASLAVLSGCFPTVTGEYDGTDVFANLYAFIVAPAASGKGSMVWAKYLGNGYHKLLKGESDTAFDMYSTMLTEYNQTKKNNPYSVEPVIPPYKILYFPANTSAAMILRNLYESEGNGVLFESEADTLSSSLMQDWGNFSDVLRKAFHHEPVSSSRKGNGPKPVQNEVNRPRLSVCLSGTPAQVSRLIHSVEDGLFSRFMFYSFSIDASWRDVSPFAKGRVNLNKHFTLLEEEALKIAEVVRICDHRFELTESQWTRLNSRFTQWLDEIKEDIPDAISSVKRMGLICFRIAMILTIVRHFHETISVEVNSNLICSDVDFDTAITLAELYKDHALMMVEQMPATIANNQFAQKSENIERAQAMKDAGKSIREIAKELGIPKSTILRWTKQ
ncbi:DUF3987 domain-containing protein [Xanthocytophaga agilis]|uniref:DUF3987 domain-containing protein n=1 Tax=Xanthocytophaga agilis TaxID=3048010 RepID=A0AAE3UDG8_9BACT|nr:DUF3987 domain-containing protein [Xanthocytophaga agilis]MDJ1501823.1 DUF3987 domain-containing protein [Xanthocytophaga agilis]